MALRLERAGFAVASAGTCPETLDRAEQHDPHLVVLDVMMPGGDGFAVARTLRRRGSGCAILMLSARGLAGDLREAYAAGADDYVIKPFDGADLVRRARRAVAARWPRVFGGQGAGEESSG